MAELNVEPKKTTPWLWIIIALIVIAAILYFVFRNDDKVEENEVSYKTEAVETYDAASGNFGKYILPFSSLS